MNILGISAYYHDSAACLFQDGKLVFACEEEKFTGIKHDSSFPINAINYIKEHYTENIDLVCYYEKPLLKLKRAFKHNWLSIPRILWTNIKLWLKLKMLCKNTFFSEHHMSHLMYAYHSSPFTEATLMSVDGVGEEETLRIVETVDGVVVPKLTIKYPHSLGLFYSAITAYLGFKPNEGEYKVMGLASYGDPTKYKGKFRKLLCYKEGLQVNMEYFTWDRSNKVMFNFKLLQLLGDNRLPEETIEQRHKDIAAALQWIYEKALFHFLNQYPGENLCLSGGCAYNGTANGKIKENTSYKNIWIPAAPSDAGSCIGACVNYLQGAEKIDLNPFLGPSYDDFDMDCGRGRDLNLNYIAKALNEGKVVGWFEGRIEFGARALGHRSILANPTLPGMQDRINALIKKREMFRPFAPMVTQFAQDSYFESSDFVPYMNQVVKVKEKYRDQLRAVTHVDGTARIQTVYDRKSNIYKLLTRFEKLSGFPILLNTSFNIKDKTMVLTPEQALRTFWDTDIDILVINHKMYLKGE
jgi:carbamoyltransferase